MDAQGREVEIKLELLAEDPLAALARRLGDPARTVEQLNRYFIPAAPAGWMVRFREEDGGLVLTVKGPRETPSQTAPGEGSDREAGVFVRTEREVPVAPEALLHLLPGEDQSWLFALAPLAGLTGPLRPAGSCRNTRRFFHHAGFTLELDRTEYPDGSIDWELEVETDRPDEAFPEVSALLSALGIPFRPATKGKFARTLERMK
ncbi:MAG: CYTH domain-containing protein [Deltaproteobacteria bacterium]|nr:CYTH domain-containing protein [Deltaproteobacteria bacterium]